MLESFMNLVNVQKWKISQSSEYQEENVCLWIPKIGFDQMNARDFLMGKLYYFHLNYDWSVSMGECAAATHTRMPMIFPKIGIFNIFAFS